MKEHFKKFEVIFCFKNLISFISFFEKKQLKKNKLCLSIDGVLCFKCLSPKSVTLNSSIRIEYLLRTNYSKNSFHAKKIDPGLIL